MFLEIDFKLDLKREDQFVYHYHRHFPILVSQLIVGLFCLFLQFTEFALVKLFNFLTECHVIIGDRYELMWRNFLLIDSCPKFSDKDGECALDQSVDVMQVKSIVPAGYGQFEHIIYELKKIGDGMGGQMSLTLSAQFSLGLALLYSKIIVLFFLHDDAEDDGFEVSEAGAHV